MVYDDKKAMMTETREKKELLTAAEQRTWDEIVGECESKYPLKINVGSVKRRAVIIKKAQATLSPPVIRLPPNPWPEDDKRRANPDRRFVVELYQRDVIKALREAGFEVEGSEMVDIRVDEIRDEIGFQLYLISMRNVVGSPRSWASMPDFMQEEWRGQADQILNYLYGKDFRKVDPSKLPVLSDEEIRSALQTSPQRKNPFVINSEIIAQAQRALMLKVLDVKG